MLVVSNTSPIMNLAVVDLLNLLRQQFGEVFVPAAVIEELRLDTDYPGTDKIRQAISEGWLHQEVVENQQIILALKRELDDGEAEAIALALQLKADLILMDERDGRSVAKSMGLNPIGILGVLVRAKQAGTIQSVKEVLNKLRNEAGFYITDGLMQNILSEIGES
jgi:predicted nucleic acid-binding protein